jgi:uncharacterized protein (DUF2236 family)
MALNLPLAELRSEGERVTTDALDRLRARSFAGLRRTIGVTGEPPAPCLDPAEAYLSTDSIVRTVHADLPSMLVGGLSSLLLQMLHPLAMAGVAQHSDYRHDPLGRLERTARFVGVTTFGTRHDAEASIARVRSIHERVVGTTSDGVPYRASDPALLTWVHVAEVRSFLAAATTYGPIHLSQADRDDYVAGMAPLAHDLGAPAVPTTEAELDAYLADIRPELAYTPEARDARNFVLRGVRRWPHEIAGYAVLVSAATGILPSWATRQLRLPLIPLADQLAVRPAAQVLCGSMRWVSAPAIR